MKSFAELDLENDGNYLKLLSAVSKISGLFSESAVPFINYRVAENIFCRSFEANNLSRSDTAFDADYNSIGIGLKTFISKTNNSTEKVAEFNSLSRDLKNYKGKDLALKLGEYRNERINLANRVYDIESSLYHIVARREKELLLFETDYNQIDIANINSVNSNKASLQFEDGHNFYSFNYSKSTLYRKFIIPEKAFRLPIDIIEDPYSLLLDLFSSHQYKSAKDKLIKGENYIVLPLYGIKKKEKYVFEKSGLNQWNAGGRKRNLGEIYIPIPKNIHNEYPKFFPERDETFNLEIPTGEVFEAKVCQDNSKALMTNPNKALSDWLLRKVLQLKEGELATIEKLDKLGFDSVIITKNENSEFKIDIMKTESYDKFLE
ncbi:restriction endonuclease [Polaribacter litorisediminis]|uniref:restriction endonuclease n=1 Tax=Polaribacter litorisediminis TaxID=1908341 RepID=UPI001CBCDB94|nr:restriction endonuclease [Polaribacter litorisediminis]UAM97337.1 restriction endonuclease [Polaribacter litorisediminis]